MGETTGSDKHLIGALFLGQLLQAGNRLIAGILDEATGVDDEHLSAARIVDRLVTKVFENPDDPMGIDEILGTAQRLEIEFHGFFPI